MPFFSVFPLLSLLPQRTPAAEQSSPRQRSANTTPITRSLNRLHSLATAAACCCCGLTWFCTHIFLGLFLPSLIALCRMDTLSTSMKYVPLPSATHSTVNHTALSRKHLISLRLLFLLLLFLGLILLQTDCCNSSPTPFPPPLPPASSSLRYLLLQIRAFFK